MTPKAKKTVIIAIPIVIAILAAILVVLFITTDFLKSNKTLFLKYMSQNADEIKILLDNKSEKEYINLLKQNKYESTSELNSKYIEKINTSEENQNNDINKLKLVVNTQSDYLNNYTYKDIKITNNDTNILRTEYLHDNEKYGIKFPNNFSQYLALRNQDLKDIAANAGMSEEQKSLIPDTIQEYDYNTVLSFTDEELETLKNTYIDIINSNISKDKYSKKKNSLITINENSINTTAYAITINQEEANDIYIKILEQLKTDEEILNKISQIEPLGVVLNLIRGDAEAYNNEYLKEKYVDILNQKIEEIRQNNIGTDEVKCTVYQLNGNLVRTQLEEKSRILTIDLDKINNDSINVEVKIKNVNDESENEKSLRITKNEENNESKISFELKDILGDMVINTKIYRSKTISDSEAKTETTIEYNDGNDSLLESTLKRTVTLNRDFEKQNFKENVNCVFLNDYKEDLIVEWKNAVLNYLNNVKSSNANIIKNVEKISLIKKILNITEDAIQTESDVTSEVDINRFNAKFEFYTGKEKKIEEIIKLLDETKNNIKNAQVSYSNEGSTEGTKKLEAIRLEVDPQANKPELADSIKEMFDESKTYKIEIEKNSSDLVKTVTISVNK